MRRGPVGAPNARAGATLGDIERGDHVHTATGWQRVTNVQRDASTVVVETDNIEMRGRPGDLVRAVRTDDRRDPDGYRSCPIDGTRHNRPGQYCSDPCADEANGQLLATREDARRWVDTEWKALA